MSTLAKMNQRYPTPTQPTSTHHGGRDFESYLGDRLIKVKTRGDRTVYEMRCINNPNHDKGEATVIEYANGKIGAGCQHASCQGSHDWQAVKIALGSPPWETAANPMPKIEGARGLPSFAGVDAAELSEYENEPIDWLVDFIFSSDQPTVFGAASKAGKTTQLIDLAAALATETKWMGEFKVSKRRKVLFITGESNKRAAAKRIRRAMDARGRGWGDVTGYLRVEAIDFPTLPNAVDQLGIQADIKKHGIDVVIIDPLYRGLMGVDSNKLADMGGAILAFAKACQPASVIISHHITKSAAREIGPPVLEDLSGAGLAESCGNWWLLGRNEPYKFDRIHDLSVTYGGRDEQAGFKRIVFDEKDWTFEITSGEDLKADREQEKQATKQAAAADKLRIAKAEVKSCLSNKTVFVPRQWIEDRTTSPNHAVRAAISDLLNGEILCQGDYRATDGKAKSGGIGFKKTAISYVKNPVSSVSSVSSKQVSDETEKGLESGSVSLVKPPLGGDDDDDTTRATDDATIQSRQDSKVDETETEI